MAKITINGALNAFLQNETWDFDPYHGYTYKADYNGASRSLMLAVQQDYVRAGIACRLFYRKGGTASLEADDATQQFTIDTWQLVGNEERFDIFSHPSVTNACTDDQIGKIRAGIENIQSGTTSAVAIAQVLADPIFNSLSAGQKIFLGRFIGLQLRGTTDYRQGQYVLRHTTNAPNRWQPNIADFGVDQIYSPAKLLTEIGKLGPGDSTNGGWIFPCPARLQYKIASISPPFGVTYRSDNDSETDFPFYFWGWLKAASTETTAANNRIEISTEYTLGNFSTDLYGIF